MDQAKNFHAVFGPYLIERGFRKKNNAYLKLTPDGVIQFVSFFKFASAFEIEFSLRLLYPFGGLYIPKDALRGEFNLLQFYLSSLIKDFEEGRLIIKGMDRKDYPPTKMADFKDDPVHMEKRRKIINKFFYEEGKQEYYYKSPDSMNVWFEIAKNHMFPYFEQSETKLGAYETYKKIDAPFYCFGYYKPIYLSFYLGKYEEGYQYILEMFESLKRLGKSIEPTQKELEFFIKAYETKDYNFLKWHMRREADNMLDHYVSLMGIYPGFQVFI